jgi:hypothetical protein
MVRVGLYGAVVYGGVQYTLARWREVCSSRSESGIVRSVKKEWTDPSCNAKWRIQPFDETRTHISEFVEVVRIVFWNTTIDIDKASL